MAQPQTFKNHARFDPAFHFFLIPMLLLNFGFSIYATIHSWQDTRPYHHRHLWWIVMSIVLLAMAGLSRRYAAKNQDRIIRLEEQLRLADLLPEDKLGLVDALTIDQYIGLRFASDAELPTLAARAVAENLTRKQIKALIVTWRPDNDRV
jgi:hypothetical protein